MKKILSTLCGLGVFVSLILAGAQAPDGGCRVIWTLGFLALAFLFGWAYARLENIKTDRYV